MDVVRESPDANNSTKKQKASETPLTQFQDELRKEIHLALLKEIPLLVDRIASQTESKLLSVNGFSRKLNSVSEKQLFTHKETSKAVKRPITVQGDNRGKSPKHSMKINADVGQPIPIKQRNVSTMKSYTTNSCIAKSVAVKTIGPSHAEKNNVKTKVACIETRNTKKIELQGKEESAERRRKILANVRNLLQVKEENMSCEDKAVNTACKVDKASQVFIPSEGDLDLLEEENLLFYAM